MGLVSCLRPCRIRKHPGLEIVGVVASIAQLAATVYGISKTLYEVSDALSNAPSDIKDLARDLETFSQELNLFYKLSRIRTAAIPMRCNDSWRRSLGIVRRYVTRLIRF